jgi:hypothetical protein
MNELSKYTADDFYINDEGYRVFTENYLLKRGYCCENWCKHCPYKNKKSLKNTSAKTKPEDEKK